MTPTIYSPIRVAFFRAELQNLIAAQVAALDAQGANAEYRRGFLDALRFLAIALGLGEEHR